MRPSDMLLLAVPALVARVVAHHVPQQHSATLNCRVALDVLEAFGVEAKPLCADVAAYNAEAWKLYCDQVPVERWPSSAHSVGTNSGLPLDPRNGLWSGWMVLTVGDRLIDPSLGKLSRPEHGIVLMPRTIGLPDGWGAPGHQLAVEVPGGVTVQYVARAETPWENAPDWQEAPVTQWCTDDTVAALHSGGVAQAL